MVLAHVTLARMTLDRVSLARIVHLLAPALRLVTMTHARIVIIGIISPHSYVSYVVCRHCGRLEGLPTLAYWVIRRLQRE
jgi:hypothetical protein